MMGAIRPNYINTWFQCYKCHTKTQTYAIKQAINRSQIKGVTEVRSKILTPLETTGGNSFSLEGFEKYFL